MTYNVKAWTTIECKLMTIMPWDLLYGDQQMLDIKLNPKTHNVAISLGEDAGVQGKLAYGTATGEFLIYLGNMWATGEGSGKILENIFEEVLANAAARSKKAVFKALLVWEDGEISLIEVKDGEFGHRDYSPAEAAAMFKG